MLVVIVVAYALASPQIVMSSWDWGDPVGSSSVVYDADYNVYPDPDIWLDEKVPRDSPRFNCICDRSNHWNTERPLLFGVRVRERTTSAVKRLQILRNRGRRPRKRIET